MHKLFRTLALVMTAMLVTYLVGCGGGETEPEGPPSATTVTADPPSGATVPSNAEISLTLDQAVDAVAGAGAGIGEKLEDSSSRKPVCYLDQQRWICRWPGYVQLYASSA